ncbi:cytochrome P450 [Streptomyces sp. NPDC050658]|uniref:cytochrome P450 n=1 Tax=unclassified Streptomyces TaxID=2593676 RepID=UPI003414EB45
MRSLPGSGGPAVIPLPSLLAPGVERDPYPLYRVLRADFPLVRDELFGAWLVSRYVDVRAVMGDVRFGARAPGAGPVVGRCAVAVVGAAVERTAYVLARRISGRREVDLVAEFCGWLPAAAAVAALGLPYGDAARVQEWCRTGRTRVGDVDGHPDLADLLRPLVARRRAHPGADLLSELCRARVDGRPLSDAAVIRLAAALLGGGGEATALALASFLANLLDHPAQLDLVRARPELIPGAWTESLRRDPPTPVVLRRASAPIAVGGSTLPAGAVVAALVGAAGRDPYRFADPDRYDIFRADPGHLALGGSARPCLGTVLAGLTAELGLRALLDAMPGLRWAPGFRPVPRGLTTRAPRVLLVRPR